MVTKMDKSGNLDTERKKVLAQIYSYILSWPEQPQINSAINAPVKEKEKPVAVEAPATLQGAR